MGRADQQARSVRAEHYGIVQQAVRVSVANGPTPTKPKENAQSVLSLQMFTGRPAAPAGVMRNERENTEANGTLTIEVPPLPTPASNLEPNSLGVLASFFIGKSASEIDSNYAALVTQRPTYKQSQHWFKPNLSHHTVSQ